MTAHHPLLLGKTHTHTSGHTGTQYAFQIPVLHKAVLASAGSQAITVQSRTLSRLTNGLATKNPRLPSILFRAERHMSFLGNSKGLLQVRMVSHSHFPLMILQPEMRFSLHGSKPSSWSSAQSSSVKQSGTERFAHCFIQVPGVQTHAGMSR